MVQPTAYLGHRLPRSAQQSSDPSPSWLGPCCLAAGSWPCLHGNQTVLGGLAVRKEQKLSATTFSPHSLLLRGGRGDTGFIGIPSQTLARDFISNTPTPPYTSKLNIHELLLTTWIGRLALEIFRASQAWYTISKVFIFTSLLWPISITNNT